MGEQKRYREWMSPIMSKDSVEDLALTNGIGPLFGFDVATANLTTGVITLGSSNNPDQAQKEKYIYLTDRSQQIEVPSHAVVTPDAILTCIYGTEDVEFDAASLGDMREIMVVATHNYIESSTVTSITSFRSIVNTTSDSWEELAKTTGNTFSDWLSLLTTVGIDQTTTVVVGVYKIQPGTGDSVAVTCYNPYRYEWPQRKGITTQQSDAIDQGLTSNIFSIDYGRTDASNFNVLFTPSAIIRAYPSGGSPISIPLNVYQTSFQKPITGKLSAVQLGNDDIEVSGYFVYGFKIPDNIATQLENIGSEDMLNTEITVRFSPSVLGVPSTWLSGFTPSFGMHEVQTTIVGEQYFSPYLTNEDKDFGGGNKVIFRFGGGGSSSIEVDLSTTRYPAMLLDSYVNSPNATQYRLYPNGYLISKHTFKLSLSRLK